MLKTETCRTNNFPTRRRARLPATVVTPLAEVAGVLDEEETRDEEEAPVAVEATETGTKMDPIRRTAATVSRETPLT